MFVLWLIAFAAFLVLESGLPVLYRNAALGVFMILVVAQFYVRCETCESSLVTYFTDSREEWEKPASFPTAVLASSCPKCGARRI
jgi:Zn finger protein HypA/HybF involved in hydrogenase expression